MNTITIRQYLRTKFRQFVSTIAAFSIAAIFSFYVGWDPAGYAFAAVAVLVGLRMQHGGIRCPSCTVSLGGSDLGRLGAYDYPFRPKLAVTYDYCPSCGKDLDEALDDKTGSTRSLGRTNDPSGGP